MTEIDARKLTLSQLLYLYYCERRRLNQPQTTVVEMIVAAGRQDSGISCSLHLV